MSEHLRLRAADPDDLQVIAACLQDALIPLREMAFMVKDLRFLASFNRFQREHLATPGTKGLLTQSQAVLRVDHVRNVKYRGLDHASDDVNFELLTILAEPLDAGGHHLSLLFAGDMVIRLEVSKLSLTLEDVGDPWETDVIPHHDLIDVPDWPTGKSQPMPIRLHDTAPDFEAKFRALIETKRDEKADVGQDVRTILELVAASGDQAITDLTERFDHHRLAPSALRLDQQEIVQAYERCDPDLRDALQLAAARITAFHRRQRPEDISYRDDLGVELGQRWRPLDAVGLYVPGGKAAYPSSVLMNALPAKVAGVERLAVAVPAPDGIVAPLVLVAAAIAGIDEVYPIGGAQAIAAFAFGTETIRPVDKIVGPGNAYVAEAKRQVFGRVGIDMIAGPSEIVVVADKDQDPAWIAADLLSQAEHDEVAQSILITDSEALAAAVEAAVAEQLSILPKRDIAAASWQQLGAVILVSTLDRAIDLVNRLAPEHLELMVAAPKDMAEKIRHAGSIFLGSHTPEVIGDYVGGPNHVLPTNRTARFASGLSVYDFMKRTTLLGCDADNFQALAPAAAKLAHAEGLAGHARAIEVRMPANGSAS